jgi:hypothetical protein
LWQVDRKGSVRHLARANVRAIVTLGAELYAVEGLAHLGSDHGSLMRIRATPSGVEVEHALELPEAPGPIHVESDALYVGADRGVVRVGPRLDVEVLPCVGEQVFSGELTEEAIDAGLSRYRPVVDRCLEPLAARPPSCDRSPRFGLWFEVDDAGDVAAAFAMDERDRQRIPEVERCLVEHAGAWRFPAPSGGWATFGATFTLRRRTGQSHSP